MSVAKFGDAMANDMYNDISYRLSVYVREYRATHKLSQAELAKQIGVTPQMVAKVESGNYNITLERLCYIMAKLNTHINVMFIDK